MALNDDVPIDEAAASTLAEAVAATSPRAAAVVREHIEDFEEILATILLAEVGKWYWRALTGEDAEDAADAARAVLAVARCYDTGDKSMRTIVATGFLEAMPYPHEDGRRVVDSLPTSLREELRAMENAKPFPR